MKVQPLWQQLRFQVKYMKEKNQGIKHTESLEDMHVVSFFYGWYLFRI